MRKVYISLHPKKNEDEKIFSIHIMFVLYYT